MNAQHSLSKHIAMQNPRSHQAPGIVYISTEAIQSILHNITPSHFRMDRVQ